MKNKLPVLDLLSEEMKKVLDFQTQNSGDAFSTEGLSYEEIRDNYRQERAFWNDYGPSMYKSYDEHIETRHGLIDVRFHYPDEKKEYPLLFFIHGGGMVVGDNDTHSCIMRTLAKRSGACVVGINYTLSPEARYPRALEECMDIYVDIISRAAELQLDLSSIGFAGDSGGANLSMGCYLRLRDEGKDVSGVRSLLLYYGLFGLTDSGSMKLLGGVWDGLTEEDMNFYMEMYLGDLRNVKSPYYNIYEADLSKPLPDSFILGCSLDPLRDDSRTLAEMLEAHGTKVEFVEVPGVLHGYLHYSKMMEASREALYGGSDFYIASIERVKKERGRE